MNNSIFCNKNLIKYLIIIGLVYTILKMIPIEQLSNKDLVLIMIIIVLGIFSLDCIFNKSFIAYDEEDFADVTNSNNTNSQAKAPANAPVKSPANAPANAPVKAPANANVANANVANANVANAPANTLSQYQQQLQTMQQLQQMQLDPKQQLMIMDMMQKQNAASSAPKQSQASQAPKQSQAPQASQAPKQSQAPQDANLSADQVSNVVAKDGSILIQDSNYIAANTDENIPANYTPTQTKVPAADGSTCQVKSPCSAEVEDLKKTLEAQISELKNQLQISAQAKSGNDFRYNELPLEMYVPLGDKVANKWAADEQYSILNTNQWQVPMPRPPVCINTEPCKVCPSDMGNYGPVPLNKFDDSRKVTNTNINRDCANRQQSS